ncbi:MAG: hypothetical protein E7478_07485 [Ruminococcaceae bacterium]|nr:hypothetical protein [Oscillospiraceae bacterium]
MLYNSLHHLISRSSSSREFFLSLPVEVQMALHKDNFFIHTQLDLRRKAEIAAELIRKELI